MNQAERKASIKEFIARWQAAAGDEDRESQKFWMELCQDVLGIMQPTRIMDTERHVRGRRIDVFFEDKGVLVEQKSRGVSLDAVRHTKSYGDETAWDQALWYYDKLPRSLKPRWIITCNFDTFRIYDMDEEVPEDKYVELTLEGLADSYHLLEIISSDEGSRLIVEKELSIQAAELVGKLYDGFAAQYGDIENDAAEQEALNKLIVRLVFLLYAEDAGMLQEHQAFLHYLQGFEVNRMRRALADLFDVLDTKYEDRSRYLDEDLAAFPYVNGGLFAGEIEIPQFTEELRECLLDQASAGFDWKGISPTIFGAAFESTLNPATRRQGGMHYTSIENIHKVIDPLFLDDLKAELAEIEGERVQRNRELRLRAFQRKLASLTFLDPACGSGNFLTETYICLRRLENRVLDALNSGNQIGMGLGDTSDTTIMVNIGQLYGIEINDFAVSVAKTALWIAEAQAMEETQEILFQVFDILPLKSISGIHHGNALRMDWSDVLPAEQCCYIMGNPPFVGSSLRTKEQTSDMEVAFSGEKKWGKCDYCAAWYKKAADYMVGTKIKAALVSTNSITQGEQVEPTWKRLFDAGLYINFAYKTFVWDSEASDKAHVHCVIVGFSFNKSETCRVFDGINWNTARNINGYLADAPNVFIKNRGDSVTPRDEIKQGNKPVDGGYLTLSEDEANYLLLKEPSIAPYILLYLGSRELINNRKRYCLWLKNAPTEILEMEDIKSRLKEVRNSRLKSPTKGFRDYADRPSCFVEDRQPTSDYIAIPEVSSQRRLYIPISLLPATTIISNKIFFIPNGTLFVFGLLSSQLHNAWMRVIAGRLKSDYSYSPSVYNNFVWPDPTDTQREAIERCAQAVLDAREAHLGKSLADLYDPDKMPADLLAAHKALDAAVEAAYGVDFQGDEEKIVAHLFKLYAEKTAGE